MKYRLTEDWLEYKKGHIMGDDDEIDYFKAMQALLLKTGILEEVKEEEWPKEGDKCWLISQNGDVYSYFHGVSYFDRQLLLFGNCFSSEKSAQEASEKIKTLLLSLKK